MWPPLPWTSSTGWQLKLTDREEIFAGFAVIRPKIVRCIEGLGPVLRQQPAGNALPTAIFNTYFLALC
jgi:hypothetical protein